MEKLLNSYSHRFVHGTPNSDFYPHFKTGLSHFGWDLRWTKIIGLSGKYVFSRLG